MPSESKYVVRDDDAAIVTNLQKSRMGNCVGAGVVGVGVTGDRVVHGKALEGPQYSFLLLKENVISLSVIDSINMNKSLSFCPDDDSNSTVTIQSRG